MAEEEQHIDDGSEREAQPDAPPDERPSDAAPEAGASGASEGDAASFEFESLRDESGNDVLEGLTLLSDVNLDVTIELGRTEMLVEDVLQLSEGAVVELDKLAGDPVDIYVNDRLVARGEVLVLNENFCVRVSEILAPMVIEPRNEEALVGAATGEEQKEQEAA